MDGTQLREWMTMAAAAVLVVVMVMGRGLVSPEPSVASRHAPSRPARWESEIRWGDSVLRGSRTTYPPSPPGIARWRYRRLGAVGESNRMEALPRWSCTEWIAQLSLSLLAVSEAGLAVSESASSVLPAPLSSLRDHFTDRRTGRQDGRTGLHAWNTLDTHQLTSLWVHSGQRYGGM